MFTRIITALAIVLGAVFSTGCATTTREVVTVTKTVNKDGTVTETKTTETKKANVVSSGYAGYYNPYFGGYVGPQAVYDPRNRILTIQESGAREPVMVEERDSRGNQIRLYPSCGVDRFGKNIPDRAGKC